MRKCFRLAAAFLAFHTAAAQAGVSSELEYRSYRAHAEHGKSLSRALTEATTIRENGRPFFGNTERDIHWQLHWRDNERGMCRIDEVRITLHTTITLPQLDGIDPDRQAEYTRFYMALRIHENGHYRIGQEMAAEMERVLASLPEAACNDIERVAGAKANDIIGQYNNRDVQYDTLTNYGRTQGAYLSN